MFYYSLSFYFNQINGFCLCLCLWLCSSTIPYGSIPYNTLRFFYNISIYQYLIFNTAFASYEHSIHPSNSAITRAKSHSAYKIKANILSEPNSDIINFWSFALLALLLGISRISIVYDQLSGTFLHGSETIMNSLNILSGRGSPPHSPSLSRSNSLGNVLASATISESRRNSREGLYSEKPEGLDQEDAPDSNPDDDNSVHESTPLLDKEDATSHTSGHVGITRMLYDSIRWVLSTLVAPGVYVIACLYNERGNFAPISQFRKLFGGTAGYSTAHANGGSPISESSSISHLANGKLSAAHTPSSKGPSSPNSSSFISSESDSDNDRFLNEKDKSTTKLSTRQTRSKSLQISDEISPQKRSIRIKLHSDDNLRQRKHRKAQSTTTQSDGSGGSMSTTEMTAAMMKSPTSPATSSLLMTKYPRAPAPPRPLIPRRQPSYTFDTPVGKLTQKTLILDLDETLIHSMLHGGRMSAGHMVEVQITNLVGGGGAGPQHPILYYVNKRPYCDDFLRRVSSDVLSL